MTQEEKIEFEVFEEMFNDILKSYFQNRETAVYNYSSLIKSLENNLEKFSFFEKNDQTRKLELKNFLKLLSVSVIEHEGNARRCFLRMMTVEVRKSRSFSQEKENQILRQLSSQLCYRFKAIPDMNITEIQVLHVSCNKDTKYMFFATNPLDNNEVFFKIQEEWEQKKIQALTTLKYQPSGKTDNLREIRKERSERHAKKLQQNVFNSTSDNNLIKFIQNHTAVPGKIFLSYESLRKLPNYGIYFVKPRQNIQKKGYKIHAEEQLCDIIQSIRKFGPASDWEFKIYGKKRPCISCLGRLCYEKVQHDHLDFSNHPGYLWIPAVLAQKLEVQKKTLKAFLSNPSSVSCRKNRNSSSVGTESNSDD